MSAKYTPKIRSFIGSCFIDGLIRQQTPTWITNTNYAEGTVVQYGSSRYVCKNTGISGTIPPTHINGTASDGAISWIWIGSITANKFFERNAYMFIGKNSSWSNEDSPDDVTTTDLEENQSLRNVTFLKKITSSDVRLAIKRVNWTTGTVYSMYDSEKDPLETKGVRAYTTPFYVLTDDNNIYKCIDNNNGAQSTIKPTDTGVGLVLLADGYVWKFLGTLEASNMDFLTDLFIPVDYKKVNDSSGQWSVQQSAKRNSISSFKILKSQGTFVDATAVTVEGGTPSTTAVAYATKNGDNTIKQVLVSNPGEGYDITQRVEAIVKSATAVGSGATVASVTVAAGVITGITLGDAGTGYTGGAICILVDPVNTPTVQAVTTVVVSVGNSISAVNVTSGGSGYSTSVRAYIVPGSAGAIARAIFAPKDGHGYNMVLELCANNVVISSKLLSASNYLLTGPTSTFRQIGIITDIYDYGTTTPSNSLMYVGPAHPQYGNVALNRIDAKRGEILYLNNVKSITRSDGQEEHLQFCLTL